MQPQESTARNETNDTERDRELWRSGERRARRRKSKRTEINKYTKRGWVGGQIGSGSFVHCVSEMSARLFFPCVSDNGKAAAPTSYIRSPYSFEYSFECAFKKKGVVRRKFIA